MSGSNIEGDWESQLADYSLGVMDPAIATEFERKLAECVAHVELARQYGQVVGLLGLSVASAEPPSGHKNRFIAKLTALPHDSERDADVSLSATTPAAPTQASPEPPSPVLPFAPASAAHRPARDGSTSNVVSMDEYRERRRLPRAVQTFGTLAAALLIVVGFWGWWNAQADRDRAVSNQNQVAQQVSTLQSENDRLRGQLSSVTAEKQKSDAAAAVLRNTFNVPGDFVPFGIAGQGDASASSAVAFLNSRTHEVKLFATGLPRLGSDQVYEAWWMPPGFPNDKPLAAGTFNADQLGVARHDTASSAPVSSFSAIAVTREPAPGGSAPKGPIVMLGKYQLP